MVSVSFIFSSLYTVIWNVFCKLIMVSHSLSGSTKIILYLICSSVYSLLTEDIWASWYLLLRDLETSSLAKMKLGSLKTISKSISWYWGTAFTPSFKIYSDEIVTTDDSVSTSARTLVSLKLFLVKKNS